MRNRIGHKNNFKNATNEPAKSEGSAKEVLEQYVSSLSGVSNGDKPSIVFLYSSGSVARSHPMFRQLSGVTKSSKAVQQLLLHTRPAFIAESSDRAVPRPRPNTTHDFRVPIGSNYFNCVSVNLFNVQPTDNDKINCLTAPLIVITNPKGEVIDIHAGPSLRSANVFRSMTKVMQDLGYKNFASEIAKANKYLNMMYRAEVEVAELKARRQTTATKNKISQYSEAINQLETRYSETVEQINVKSSDQETTETASAM